MGPTTTLNTRRAALFSAIFSACVLCAGHVQADDANEGFSLNKLKASYVEKKFSKHFKVRGWKVAEKVYFGQAKVAGRYGLGVVIEQDGFSWGFNHRGIGLFKRF